MPSLAQLVEEGAFPEAYARVVELWRRKPYASLAALAAELAARAGAETVTPTKMLASSIVGGNSVASHKKLSETFAALAPDPHVFEWMVQELGHPRFDLSSGNPRALYALIVAQMAKLQDERIAPWVAALPAFMQEHKGRRHGQLSPEEIEALTEIFAGHSFKPAFLEAFTEDEETELAAVRAPLDALEKQVAEREGQRARLFEQVCADFEDDVAKEVFADYLLETRDKLGEYIVLSLKLAREGELPPALEGQHRGLSEHARRFQPMGRRFERGFAVEARFTDGEGIRRGSYGLEPGWGTIAFADVPPTSDDCHTQSLRELDLGTTFIADLAKLKKPLRVTKLKWRTPSKTGRPKWKKIAVLPELEELTISGPAEGTYEWLLLEGPGPNLRSLTIEHWNWGRHAEWIGEVLRGGKAGALEHVRLGPRLTFTRRDGRTRLAISVPDAGVLAELQRELTSAPRPLVDEVVIDGPGEPSTYTSLLTLGTTSRTELTASPAADAARVTREDDTLVIAPVPEHPVFDVSALRAVLAKNAFPGSESTQTPGRVSIRSAALIEETAAYFQAIREWGASTLLLTLGPPAWRRGRFALTVSGESDLDVDLGRFDHAPLVQRAVASFGGRVKKLVVRHPPSMKDVPNVTAPLAELAADFTLVPEERVLASMFRYENVKGRASLDSVAAYARLMPATADLILEGKPRPKELRVGQNEFAIAPWMAWVTRTRLPVTFALDWRFSAWSKVSWDNGLTVRLSVDGRWNSFVANVADVPDGSIEVLDLRSSIAPTADAKAAILRIAKTHTIVS